MTDDSDMWHDMVHRGQTRHFQNWAIDSVSTQFQDLFGPNPIFLPYLVTKFWILCCLFSHVFLLFTPYFCLYLNFTLAYFLAVMEHIRSHMKGHESGVLRILICCCHRSLGQLLNGTNRNVYRYEKDGDQPMGWWWKGRILSKADIA